MNDNSGVELIDVAMEIGTGSGTGDAIGVDQANGSLLCTAVVDRRLLVGG